MELYPGLIVEDAKDSMVPGSGLCANYTISRAILSDAVALVRGDRFYTADYPPKHLTNWAYNKVNYDTSVDQGQVFYKLALRAFPNHFRSDSVYAHFPMVVPSESRKILTRLALKESYSFIRPNYNPPPRPVTSYATCMSILTDKEVLKVIWGKKLMSILRHNGHPYGRDYMMSGDGPTNEASHKMMGCALYQDKWHCEARRFYDSITIKLLERNSYQVSGANQIDAVRDMARLAQVHFCSSVFSLPLKTESNPAGLFTEYMSCIIF